MIKRYIYGNPFNTEAVVENIEKEEGIPSIGNIALNGGFVFAYEMKVSDRIYGLGEANRGINKRGYRYVSFCSDDPNHTEDKVSLYGAHNFVIISGDKHTGLFIDYPSKVVFDIGYTKSNIMTVSVDRADLNLYVIEGDSDIDVVRQFRKIIGQSYIPPMFAFGYGQSRWGYKDKNDFNEVLRKHRDNHIPLDMIYMDIDYMDAYKDFTVNKQAIGDLGLFVKSMKEENIHLIPIIDAGVKAEDGYDVYEEGKEKGYFCKLKDGSDYKAAVWPGITCLPDVLNPEARAWFGSKYKMLTDAGIDGFWNDMNEPAIFYTPMGVSRVKEFYECHIKDADSIPSFELCGEVNGLANNIEDYTEMYHTVDGELICHRDVHNLYGYNMTRAAAESFEQIAPGKEILLFSRSSYIGMHRYSGIWTGDNMSWWSHILLNLKMLPSLNMCGFLYVGADLGGFGCDTTEDLLLRWLALGVFTPLMRNHSADHTRRQEVYQFERLDDFRHIIEVRYRLIPYLREMFVKAARENDMMFKPLSFVYTDDSMAAGVEDQLMLGDELMIAPVYSQNATGRYVYLPEEMMFVKFMPDGSISRQVLDKGHHYVDIAINEVPLFIRKDKSINIVKPAEYVDAIDMSTIEKLGY